MTTPYGGGTFQTGTAATGTGSGIAGNQFVGISPPWTGNFQTDLNNFVNAANKKGDKQLASQFRTWALQQHAKHPELTVEQLLQAFLQLELAGALGTTIGETGTMLGQIPGAAAKGAENAINVLGGFNLTSWFLRIGEILLGIVLIGVGIARITGVQNAVSQFVKTKVPIPV